MSSFALSNLLHAELAEIENRVADRRHRVGVAVDRVEHRLLAVFSGLRRRHSKAGERESCDRTKVDGCTHAEIPSPQMTCEAYVGV